MKPVDAWACRRVLCTATPANLDSPDTLGEDSGFHAMALKDTSKPDVDAGFIIKAHRAVFDHHPDADHTRLTRRQDMAIPHASTPSTHIQLRRQRGNGRIFRRKGS